MNLRDASDNAALGLGLITGAVLVCAGAEVVTAAVLGGMVALAIDVPFGSITHVTHQGTIRRPHMQTQGGKRRTKTPHLKPTGYAYGSFGRM